MTIKYFETQHPKNGFDMVVGYNNELKIESVEYVDGEDIELTKFVRSYIENEISSYHSN